MSQTFYNYGILKERKEKNIRDNVKALRSVHFTSVRRVLISFCWWSTKMSPTETSEARKQGNNWLNLPHKKKRYFSFTFFDFFCSHLFVNIKRYWLQLNWLEVLRLLYCGRSWYLLYFLLSEFGVKRPFYRPLCVISWFLKLFCKLLIQV